MNVTPRFTVPALATAGVLLIAGVVGIASGCGSSDATSSASTATAPVTRAAAGPDPNGDCGPRSPGAGIALTMSNATSEPITWNFGGVNCASWKGVTPVRYAPLTVGPGQSETMAVDIACGWIPFTASLSRPSSPNPERVARTVKIEVNRACDTQYAMKLLMYAQDYRLPKETAKFVQQKTIEVPTGGRSWSITSAITGKRAATVAVSQ